MENIPALLTRMCSGLFWACHDKANFCIEARQATSRCCTCIKSDGSDTRHFLGMRIEMPTWADTHFGHRQDKTLNAVSVSHLQAQLVAMLGTLFHQGLLQSLTSLYASAGQHHCKQSRTLGATPMFSAAMRGNLPAQQES